MLPHRWLTGSVEVHTFVIIFFLRASATGGGTMPDTSPPKEASSLIEEERKTKYSGSVDINIVSILESRALFIIESSNS